jgi:hypothetical protein
MNTDFVGVNGYQSAFFNVSGKLEKGIDDRVKKALGGKLKGLHNIFPFNVGIIGQQFFNGLSRADLGNYPSDGNPCSPDTGFAPHDGGVQTDTIQIFIVHHRSSIFQKAEQDNTSKRRHDMKKRCFATMFALFVAAALSGQTTADFEYEADNGEATITGYTGSAKDVTIPEWIDKLPVTAIGDGAFQYKQLTGVTIPGSVTVIGDTAFMDNRLTQLAIPGSVTVIGEAAFMKNQFTSVTIPGGVTLIGWGAFEENQLTHLTIGSGVTGIGNAAFADNQLTQLTIPGSVTAIGDYAFANNQLSGVVIPGSVTAIGASAFYHNQLTSVTIPGSVTALGHEVFADNPLTSVTIPANVRLTAQRAYGDTFKEGPFPGNLVEVYRRNNSRAGTYRSRDGGETWTRQR